LPERARRGRSQRAGPGRARGDRLGQRASSAVLPDEHLQLPAARWLRPRCGIRAGDAEPTDSIPGRAQSAHRCETTPAVSASRAVAGGRNVATRRVAPPAESAHLLPIVGHPADSGRPAGDGRTGRSTRVVEVDHPKTKSLRRSGKARSGRSWFRRHGSILWRPSRRHCRDRRTSTSVHSAAHRCSAPRERRCMQGQPVQTQSRTRR
jgi:hypothetical protein